ncbi:hypothetical protein P9VFCI_124 [Rhizobium phage P9VFCI]|uniref:Uncharacterized protein n=3 Tax=Innesvirus TaxID=3044739 RepID=A0A076YKR5_9CAUD|nr:hypothetical protein P10VF_169 [Rhizobium phage vB_RleM_P10VF]YP_010662017.1 hypothetical protein PP937_gp124 [Rhizobium phage P9VFCI]YP_010662349.1 hypothetical protein PP938_gp199 [Rhizobium phage AF3]AIK68382.1 hypothetical protein P10VF_169 [Rhizobium phage vB_RleM_P10VF]QNH71493.1 hypothetical protein AF3_199 [Rhizobium phage AF3]QNH71913.1 hypothetical protein P9VFCI_124 [Rhizobium phage P9VFCI]
MTDASSLGHELKEYYWVSKTGYKLLIAVSKGFDGGLTFNTASLKCEPFFKDMFRKLTGRLYHSGGYITDSDNNHMEVQELFDFAAYSRGRPPVEGSLKEVVIDSNRFMFGEYKPAYLYKIY